MSENKRFVMLGERDKKGRIAKNESYSVKMIKPLGGIPHIGFLDFFRPKTLARKLENIRDRGYAEGNNEALNVIQKEINHLIDKDNFGKKKK